MPTTSTHNTAHDFRTFPDSANTRVYSIRSFLTIQTLMRKLNLTPADCLELLAEKLEDLDRQIEDYEDRPPYPLSFLDERP